MMQPPPHPISYIFNSIDVHQLTKAKILPQGWKEVGLRLNHISNAQWQVMSHGAFKLGSDVHGPSGSGGWTAHIRAAIQGITRTLRSNAQVGLEIYAFRGVCDTAIGPTWKNLTSQLLRLTSQSRFSDALTLLHTSPSRAATTVVWNVLLNSILQNNNSEGTGQIKRAYEVWMDMKKRGVRPTSRSFGTFLGGAAKVARKIERQGIARGDGPVKEAIGNDVKSKVETVYKQWTVYQSVLEEKGSKASETSEAVKEHEETVEDLTVHPTNQYISFLAASLTLSKEPATSSHLLSQILKTFESIPPPSSAEPITRNAVTYALTLNAIRTSLQIANSPKPPTSFPTTPVLLESALAIFTPLLSSTRLPESDPLTPQLATSFLSLFLLPSPSTISLSLQSTILDLLPTLHGLVQPSELASIEPPVSSSVPTPISSPALDAGALKCVMSLLLKWEKLEWVQGVWEQVNEYPERYFASQKNETEIEHAEIMLEALGRQGDLESAEALLQRLLLASNTNLKPRLKTLETVLDASLRSNKYETAWRTYELFSPAASSPLDPTSTSLRVPFSPSFKATTSLLLTAYNTRDKTKIWSTIKSLSSPPSITGGSSFSTLFGPNVFPPSSSSPAKSKRDSTLTKKELAISRIQEKRDMKWQVRYGEAVSKSLERILKGREIKLGGAKEEEDVRKGLEEWRERIEAWIVTKEKEMGGSSVRGKGEMELRRERLEIKDETTEGDKVVEEVQRASKTLSQEDLERLAVGQAGGEESENGIADEPVEGERKIQRKERRMGWWKEREGDSMKEEHAIYESRQRKFDAKKSDGSRRTSFREERSQRPTSSDRRGGYGRYERGFEPRTSYDKDGRSDTRPRREGSRGGERKENGDRPRRQSSWE
ncbi:hypothetical protein JCM16303_004068 [Sporobolomyces ruberrimus]